MFPERYQLSQSVRFQAEGKRLSPKKLNPILARFSILLSEFKADRDGLRAWVSGIAEFQVLKDGKEKVIFEYAVKWEVCDSGQNSIYNFNSVTRPWLHQCIQKIMLKESGVKISHLEGRFPHEFWDKEI